MKRALAGGALRRATMRQADICQAFGMQWAFASEIPLNDASISVSRRISTAC
jgi:hypothetical protein